MVKDKTTRLAPTLAAPKPTSSLKPELEPGDRVGPLTVRSKIGAGGFGTVYLAHEEGRTELVAAKVLNPEWAVSADITRRFLKEIRALERVQHPSVVKIFGSSVLPDGRPMYWMEFVEGEGLSDRLRRKRALSPEEVLSIVDPLCSALALVHERGIVHRDLKCSNVRVSLEPAPRVVKLLDFGIARVPLTGEDRTALTQTNQILGTCLAMAPEQIRCEPVDGRCDIYGLGVMCFRLLSGRFPFFGDNELEVQRMHLEEPAPRISSLVPVSAALDQVIGRCLEKDRARRFQTVGELIEALRGAVRAGAPSMPPLAEAPRLIAEAPRLIVEARAPAEVESDPSVLADLVAITQLAEDALRAAGLQLELITLSTVIARADDCGAASVAGLEQLVASLRAQLTARPTRDDRVRVELKREPAGSSK